MPPQTRVFHFWLLAHGRNRDESVTPTDKKIVFISYGRADALDFAKRLATDLEQRGGHAAWLDLSDIEKGGEFDVRIEDGIKSSDIFAAVMSLRSQEDDSVCRDEVVFAINAKKRVVPLRASSDRRLRPTLLLCRRNWIDFTDDYDAGLEALLSVLNGDDSQLMKPVISLAAGREPIDFSGEIARHQTCFLGREWLRARVDGWLDNSQKQVLLVVAEPGVGKSAISSWRCRTMGDVVGVHFCTHRIESSLDPRKFVASLAAQLASELVGFREELEKLDAAWSRRTAAGAFRDLVIKPALSLDASADRPTSPRVIVLDGLDEGASTADWQSGGESGGRDDILSILELQGSELPPWLRVVATCQPESYVRRMSGEFEVLKIAADCSGNLSDVNEYVQLRVHDAGFPPMSESERDTVAVQVADLAVGNFQYAKLTLDALQFGGLSPSDLGGMVPGLDNYYTSIFRQRFGYTGEFRRSHAPILEALCASRAPLPYEVVSAIHGGAEQEANSALRDLSPFLASRGRNRARVFSLFHHSLADWLVSVDTDAAFSIDPAIGHNRLSEAGLAGTGSMGDLARKYFRDHLPMHLVGASRWNDLLALISDTSWGLLEKWCDRGYAEEGETCMGGVLAATDEWDWTPARGAALATQLARVQRHKGEYAAALRVLRESVSATSVRERRIRSIAAHESASLHLNSGGRGEAIRGYLVAAGHALLQLPADRGEVAANVLSLGTVASGCDRYRLARLLGRAAQGLARQAGDPVCELSTMRMLAGASTRLGDFAASSEYMQKAFALCRRTGAHAAPLLVSQGWLEYGKAVTGALRFSAAASSFDVALQLSEKRQDRFYRLASWKGLGWVALGEARVDDARHWFDALTAGVHEGEHEALHVNSLVGRAAVQHAMANLTDAEVLYENALSSSPRRMCALESISAAVGLGGVLFHTGRQSAADAHWRRALMRARGLSKVRVQMTSTSIERCKGNPSVPPLL